jgi:hypothetical protein
MGRLVTANFVLLFTFVLVNVVMLFIGGFKELGSCNVHSLFFGLIPLFVILFSVKMMVFSFRSGRMNRWLFSSFVVNVASIAFFWSFTFVLLVACAFGCCGVAGSSSIVFMWAFLNLVLFCSFFVFVKGFCHKGKSRC